MKKKNKKKKKKKAVSISRLAIAPKIKYNYLKETDLGVLLESLKRFMLRSVLLINFA